MSKKENSSDSVRGFDLDLPFLGIDDWPFERVRELSLLSRTGGRPLELERLFPFLLRAGDFVRFDWLLLRLFEFSGISFERDLSLTRFVPTK